MNIGYRVELTQIDPSDSPTPGLGHFAGELPETFPTLRAAKKAARKAKRRLIGNPVPTESFYPCCPWQRRDTPVAFVTVVDLNGEHVEE